VFGQWKEASPPLNVKTGDVIIFCLVRAIADFRGRWKVRVNECSGWTLNSKENAKIVKEKPHFV